MTSVSAGHRVKADLTRMIAIVLLSTLCVHHSVTRSGATEENKRWGWFSALSLKDKWWVLEGDADVVIKDGKITAELYDENGFHRMSASGSIKDAKLDVVITRHGTDDDLRKMTGMMTTYEWGRESILLFQDRAGGLVIGITRD